MWYNERVQLLTVDCTTLFKLFYIIMKITYPSLLGCVENENRNVNGLNNATKGIDGD